MSTGNVPESVLSLLARKTPETRIAVLGASNNPEKYGNIIVKNLLGKGYGVLPVNPREEVIEGLQVVSDPASLPDPVHLVNFVTPPAVSMKIVEALEPARFPVLWFQDGSFNDEVLELAGKRFETVVAHACIMVVTNYT